MGAIIILLGGVGVLGLAMSPLLWTRDAEDGFRLKQLRSGVLLVILFVVLAALHYFTTRPEPPSRDTDLRLLDVSE